MPDQALISRVTRQFTIYVSGDFTTLGGQPRSRFGAVNAASGSITAWDPGENAHAWALLATGDKVHAAGGFTTLGGETREYLAAVDATTGVATDWNPQAADIGRALAFDGSVVFGGGDFTSINTVNRPGLAAIDLATGEILPWNPGISGSAYELVWSGSSILVAAVDAASASPRAWDPNAGESVYALAMKDGVIYAGGTFTYMGNESRHCLAAVDAVTAAVLPWDPTPSGVVNGSSTSIVDLIPAGSRLYVIGSFMSITGLPHSHFAALVDESLIGVGDTPRPSKLVARVAGPNPFHTATSIEFTLARESPVTLTVHDVSGREVVHLARGERFTPGPHRITFDRGGVAEWRLLLRAAGSGRNGQGPRRADPLAACRARPPSPPSRAGTRHG